MFGTKKKQAAFDETMDQIDDVKKQLFKKFDDYDREFRKLSKSAKICIGVSLGLSVADTIIMLKMLKKMR